MQRPYGITGLPLSCWYVPCVSMNGEYLQLRPEDLTRALVEPEWLDALVEAVYESDDETRHLETDKAWDAIRFLLARRDFPVDIVQGEEALGHDDWGYGPPRYLTPERVRVAADALERVSFDDLVSGVEPRTLRDAEVYPTEIWEEADALEFVRAWFEPLPPYFRRAANAGDAIAIWLS